jgi:hypothetical protein
MTGTLITWREHHAFATGTLSSGWSEAAQFLISFRHSADGRSVKLKHDGEYIGSYKTVGAAKCAAVRIVKSLPK